MESLTDAISSLNEALGRGREAYVLPSDFSTLREQQWVRMDGTVVQSFLVAPGWNMTWSPPLGQEIWGPIVYRQRSMGANGDGPVSDWQTLLYYPDGYPGEPYMPDCVKENGDGSYQVTVKIKPVPAQHW